MLIRGDDLPYGKKRKNERLINKGKLKTYERCLGLGKGLKEKIVKII